MIEDPGTVVTKGATAENSANLAPAFLDQIMRTYGGTRLARQEIDGEMLMDTPGALWRRRDIDLRRLAPSETPSLAIVVVAVDPAVSMGANSDETGIIVAGVDEAGIGYVLEDLSGRHSPDTWARLAIEAYHRHEANALVAEVNQGGDLVVQTLRTVDPAVPVRSVRASRGKRSRAEPVAALYEQGRVRHVGAFPDLEDQLCAFTGSQGEASPDRLDAMVWAMSDLLLGRSPARSEEFLL